MADPFVTASSSRRKETSCGASPGFESECSRMLKMRTGLPVSVDRTSRVVRWGAPVKRSGAVEFGVVIV